MSPSLDSKKSWPYSSSFSKFSKEGGKNTEVYAFAAGKVCYIIMCAYKIYLSMSV